MIHCTKNNLCFNRGDILTSNMLKLMYNTPNELLNATLLNYPNGIVSGFNLHLDSNHDVVLSSGLVKTSYGLYYMDTSANITQELSTQNATVDTLYRLVLQKGNPEWLEKSIERDALDLEFIPNSNTPLPKDAVTIGTLYYDKCRETSNTKEPTTLTEVSRNFKSCLNLWNCEYSMVSGVALHPMVAQLVYKELYSKPNYDFLDVSLMSAINSNGTVTRESIRCFCKQKLSTTLSSNWNTSSNVDILIRAINETVAVLSTTSKSDKLSDGDKLFKPIFV